MKHPFFVLRLKKLLLYGACLFLMLVIIITSNETMNALRKALSLCAQTVIPSLFPFFVLSSFLAGSGFANALARLFSPIMQPLFRMDGAASLPFVMGILSGYPTGAKTALELYRSGSLSKDEAQRLLPFSNNSGPLFLMGAVGTGMLGNPRLGLFLYGVHLTSALSLGLLLRFLPGKAAAPKCRHRVQNRVRSFSALLTDAISGSAVTMLSICGYILFFAALSSCLAPFLSPLPESLSLTIQSLLEITAGAKALVEAGHSPRLTLAALSAFIGFGGLCVTLQVAGILASSGLSLKIYLWGKILQGVIAGLLAFVFYPLLPETAINCGIFTPFFPQNVSLWENLPEIGAFLTILCLIILFINDKKNRV